jgi:ornithine cyclodeaminase/alanine dehydrogenase-like protein (mu-crystallin family)
MKRTAINSLLILSKDDIRELVTLSECIDLMRSAFRELSAGSARIPQRLALEHPEYNGTTLFMPGYHPGKKQLGIKIVTLFRNNTKYGIPLIHGLILIFDTTNGLPIALLDAEHLTALRTGAASGLATDLLARRDAHIVALFGAGKQGEFQIAAVNLVRKIKKAYVHDPDSVKAEAFCKKISKNLNLEIEYAPDPSVVKDADIICTATPSALPVFKAADVRPGAHINAIGSYKPDKTEIPLEIVARAKIVVDSRSAALSEAGEIVQAIKTGKITADSLFAEIGELLIYPEKKRSNDTEITFFKSVGNAIQDIETAHFIIQRARERGVGTTVTI